MLLGEDNRTISWQAPPREMSGQYIKGFFEEIVQQGDNWVQNQPGIANLTNDIQLLMGTGQDRDMPSNLLQPDIRSFVETITDLRQIATMGSKAEQSKKTVALYNDIFKFVFWDSLYVPNTRKALQWAMLGRGYKWQKFSRPWHGGGTAKIKFEALGPREFLPDQLPHNADIDDAYAGTIVFPMGLAEAHARFEQFQKWLTPISQYSHSGVNVTQNMLRRYEFYDRWRFGGSNTSEWVEKYALDVDTPISVPTGWKRMGDLEDGDYVFGGDGSLCKVKFSHPPSVKDSYKLTFDNGDEIIASGDHEWLTRKAISKGNLRTEKIAVKRSTEEIYKTQTLSHKIDLVQLDCPEPWLPIDPYLFGLWLGDGFMNNGEIIGLPEDLSEVEKVLHSKGHTTVSFTVRSRRESQRDSQIASLRIGGFERALRTYGYLRNKRIPNCYLRGSVAQRKELLKGLMDTDGWNNHSGVGWGQSVIHKDLVRDVSELLASLGIKHQFHTYWRVNQYGNTIGFMQCSFSPTFSVFNMPRKKEKQLISNGLKSKAIRIVSVEPVGKRQVRCITVDSGDHTFLAGRSMVRTHNCEIRYHFIHDLRINDTGYTQQMGVDGTTWGYKVPTLGDLIVTIDPDSVLPRSRKAELQDCRMYPRLRLVITSPSCPVPLYDDTAFDWHAKIPVTQHDVNDWVWSPMGYSIVSGVKGLEVARRDRLSDINTVLSVRKDPPLGTDVSTGVSRTQMDKLDLLHAQGVRVGGKGDPSKWTKSLLPPEVDVDEKDFKGVDMLGAAIKGALGLTDISSMREVKGNMSDQAFDKMVENLGPVAKGIALNQWIANSKDANMLKYNIAQYFTPQMLMDMIGPESVGVETFDNDPNSLVPSHLPGEDEDNVSAHSRQDRAKWFCERLKVINTPAQLLNVTHIQERMLNMFMIQQKLPVDMETTMEKVGVPDYQVRHERFKEEQLADAIWKLEVEKTLADKAKSLGMEQPQPEPPGKGRGGGRKQTGKKGQQPAMKGSQSGNVRVVNKSS